MTDWAIRREYRSDIGSGVWSAIATCAAENIEIGMLSAGEGVSIVDATDAQIIAAADRTLEWRRRVAR